MFDDEDDYDYEDPIGPPVPSRERAEWFIRTAVLFESFLAFVAIGLGWAVGVAPWISASWESGSPLEIFRAIGIGALATLPLLAAFLWMQHAQWEGLNDLSEFMERQIIPLFQKATVVELLLISLAAGVGEEALFRGVIQTFLQQLIGTDNSPVVPIVLASLLFGVVHFMTKEYFLISAVMGAYLGLWFWWTGDLIVPIVIHALYDWFALVYMRQTISEEDASPVE